MILAILFRPFRFIAPKNLNYLAFQSFDFECTWWRLFHKRVVCTKLDIYVFIITNWWKKAKLFFMHFQVKVQCWYCQLITTLRYILALYDVNEVYSKKSKDVITWKKVWRYQRGNQKPSIEEGQTIQLANGRDKQQSTEHATEN